MSTDVNVILVYSEHVPSLLSCPSVAIFINAQLINPLCFAFPQEPRVAVAIHLDKHSFKQKAEVYWTWEVKQSPALRENLNVWKQST
jgi:hypothetical protein